MKIIAPKRGHILIALTMVAVALLSIGYLGIGQDILAKTTTATIIEHQTHQPTEENVEVVNQQGQADKNSAEFFIEYRLERERTRGQQVEWLREIINNENADAETRKKAQEQLYTISQNIGKEMEIENLIRAKGYQDAVVLLQDKVATVVVRSKALATDDVAKIAELVSRNTGISLQNIVIIPKQ
ncbi:SpoIIIAH-like family protein [Peptococcaceae bacterium 1198_IL3148]